MRRPVAARGGTIRMAATPCQPHFLDSYIAFPFIVIHSHLSFATMAPASRPILAISEDGSVTRHLSKRAASEATGIPAASVALAATNLALRDGFLWKFEDDPRDVDMSRFSSSKTLLLPPVQPVWNRPETLWMPCVGMMGR